MHGKGKQSWQDGRFYEGEFVNGKRQGNGVFQWTDGRAYNGEWRDGCQDGFGEFLFITGNKKMGEWKEGKHLKWFDAKTKSVQPNSCDEKKSASNIAICSNSTNNISTGTTKKF